MSHGKETKYPGVTYVMTRRLTGFGEERMYYIRYRRGGRGSKETFEPVGRESEGMTAAKANLARAARMAGTEMSNKERRAAEKEARQAQKANITVSDLWERYCEANSTKPSLRRSDQFYYNHFKDLGSREVSTLTTEDVETLRRRLASTPSSHQHLLGKTQPLSIQSQKHVLELFRRIINFGVKQDLISMPPRLHFTMPKVDNITTEYMNEEQLARYRKALDEDPNQKVADILRLDLVTGMRKGGLLALQWDDCDFENRMICLRGESAKKGKTEYIPMNDSARDILLRVTRTESSYVFPGKNGKKRTDISKIARRVRERAGLPADFRPLHGLRHNFASRLASSGRVDMYNPAEAAYSRESRNDTALCPSCRRSHAKGRCRCG